MNHTSPTIQLQPLRTSVFIRLAHLDWLFQGIACQKALMGKGLWACQQNASATIPSNEGFKILKEATDSTIDHKIPV